MTHPDVVVVGAGILGASIALELRKAGAGVTVVEKNAVGGGSTGACSGCIRQGYGTAEAVLLARDSLRAWERWEDYAEVPRGDPLARFENTGVAYLLPDGESARRQAALMRSCGVPVEVWSQSEILHHFPDWDLEGVAAAIFEPEGGYVGEPDLAAKNVMSAARHRGAQLVIDRIVGIDHDGRGVSGAWLASGKAIPTRAVVNAAGPWAFQVNRMAGVSVPLRPVRHRTILVPALERARGRVPVVADLALKVYFRADPTQGGFLAGSLDDERDGEPWADPDAADPGVDRAFFAAKNTSVARRMPERVGFPSGVRGIGGLYDVHEPDWYPVFDRTELDGFFLAAGTSGAWFKGGPSIGAILAHLVLGGGPAFRLPRTGEPLDLKFFRRDRAPIVTTFAGGVIG